MAAAIGFGKGDRGLTKHRRLVLEILSENAHLDAYEIHAEALKRDARISLPTVYRALKYLKEKGLIVEHRFNENHSHYEIADEEKGDIGKAFVHLICERCGKIEDEGSIELFKNGKGIVKKDFHLSSAHLNLYGICQSCLVNSKNGVTK